MTSEPDLRLRQISHNAASEPIGSKEFYLQFGLVFLGALSALVFLGVSVAVWWWALYLAAFVVEKRVAHRAVVRSMAAAFPVCLGLLFLRSSIYHWMARRSALPTEHVWSEPT